MTSAVVLWGTFLSSSTANRPGYAYEQLLPGDTSSHVIDSLEEDKKYTVHMYAVYPQGPSEPVSADGRTCEFKSMVSLSRVYIVQAYCRWKVPLQEKYKDILFQDVGGGVVTSSVLLFTRWNW